MMSSIVVGPKLSPEVNAVKTGPMSRSRASVVDWYRFCSWLSSSSSSSSEEEDKEEEESYDEHEEEEMEPLLL